jgi:hypothetical protein
VKKGACAQGEPEFDVEEKGEEEVQGYAEHGIEKLGGTEAGEAGPQAEQAGGDSIYLRGGGG